jgi:hypothetical protein
MEKPISKSIMERAFKALDRELPRSLTLILGGGGCMIFAHGFPLATTDIDALPIELSFEEIDPLVKKLAKELNLPGDWLNPYFSTFIHVLPDDYQTRVVEVFKGKNLKVLALGKEEMLIMKCFAHRPKDVGHARALVKAGCNLGFVEAALENHKRNRIPKASEALEFFDNLQDELQ